MAEPVNATLNSLSAQVNELSTMLDQVESGLQDIQRAWDGMSRREFRRYGVASSEKRRQNAKSAEGTDTLSSPFVSSTSSSSNSSGDSNGSSELLQNLGAMFGKSPAEMLDLLGKARQILAGVGNGQGNNSGGIGAAIQQILGGSNLPTGAASPNGISGGASASVASVAAHLPTKLQTVANSVYEAANQDPFVRTAVELDSRLRNMSETIESVIGIFLLIRDISTRAQSI